MNEENQHPKDLKWSVMSFWNQLLGLSKRRPPKVRDYISPSDLGKDYWGRYQKMMGETPDKPFADRVLRVFAAGDEYHNLMGNVFKALGIFINSQDDLDENGEQQWSIVPATDKSLKTLGKYDALVGGKPDIEAVKKHCEDKGFSDFVTQRTIMMAEGLAKAYPEGLPKMIYEFKSINSMAFWHKKDYLAEAYPHHRYQLFNYLKANNIPEGRILYISKDDLMTAEFAIRLDDPKMNALFDKDREEMSHFWNTKTEPPKPANVVFDSLKKLRFQFQKKKLIIVGCWTDNWEVERSQYFYKLTGCKDIKQWQGKNRTEILSKNNELKEKVKNQILAKAETATQNEEDSPQEPQLPETA